MLTIYSPPAGKGRRRITGTVVRDYIGHICIVRLVYSESWNTGNTGSPRVELWIGLREATMRPVVLRRAGDGEWEQSTEFGLRRDEVRRALELCGYRPKDTEPDGEIAWPQLIWDRRVLLPDDKRFPKAKKFMGKIVSNYLARRNECPDEEVWRIDAVVLAMSPRKKDAPQTNRPKN